MRELANLLPDIEVNAARGMALDDWTDPLAKKRPARMHAADFTSASDGSRKKIACISAVHKSTSQRARPKALPTKTGGGDGNSSNTSESNNSSGDTDSTSSHDSDSNSGSTSSDSDSDSDTDSDSTSIEASPGAGKSEQDVGTNRFVCSHFFFLDAFADETCAQHRIWRADSGLGPGNAPSTNGTPGRKRSPGHRVHSSMSAADWGRLVLLFSSFAWKGIHQTQP